MKFKVGDKVRIVQSPELVAYYGGTTGTIGAEGEVINYREGANNPYVVEFEKRLQFQAEYYSEHELEHLRVRYNRLAEKLYPKGYRDGDWWYLNEI